MSPRYGPLNGWAEFSECVQESEPTTYAIDVKRTDSIMTPFIGTLTVPVALSCTVRQVIPPGTFVTKDKAAKLEAACFGHTYEECIASEAARPVPKTGMYAGLGGDKAFAYTGKVVTAYRWSEGKWEFNEDKADPPLPLIEPKGETKTASSTTQGDEGCGEGVTINCDKEIEDAYNKTVNSDLRSLFGQ